MRRVLVVANRTLEQEALLETIRSRAAEGPCEFTVLVPATAAGGGSGRSGHDGAWRGAAGQAGDFLLPEPGYDKLHQRLERALDRFRRAGATVDGHVGGSNVLDAIGEALHGPEFDEIILSTLPKRVSQWLHQDLAHRVKRRFRIPVTVVTPR